MAAKKQQVRKINSNSNSSSKQKGSRNPKAAAVSAQENSLSRRIGGVCLIFLGVILLILAALKDVQGAVSQFLSTATHMCFGICCYIFPFVLIAIGVSLFIKNSDTFKRANFIIGLSIFFVGFITLVAMMAPIAVLNVDDPNLLFSDLNLTRYGGYLGNSIGWVLISLFGKIVSSVICVLIMVIGAIVAGFSFSILKERIRAAKSEKEEKKQNQDLHYVPLEQAQIRLTKDGDIDVSSFAGCEGGKTTVLSNLHDSINDDQKSRKRPQPKTRNATANDLNNIATVPADAETAQLTRKITKNPRANKKPVNDLSKLNASNVEENPALSSADSDFKLPSMDLLEKPKETKVNKNSDIHLAEVAAELQQSLEDFGVPAQVVGWVAGPTVTLFKIELPAGVRVNKIQNLGTDLALALAATSVRIFAPIPGTNYVGIEVPNQHRETVYLSEILRDAKPGPLQIAIGKDVEGNSIVTNLATMPHLLIGGTTGSGKSVSVNAMIMSILMRATPDDVRFIMIDPKRVEFTPYNGIPHLYAPVVTEPKEAASALTWAVAEMERRLKIMSEVAARNIKEYNAKVKEGSLDEIKKVTSSGPSEEKKHVHLPYIVIIIDELADLMMCVGKEVESSICRLAQLARAAGIHLIVATQRPSTNVVTGLIKSNITNRIAFNVASSIDSRVILDQNGAEDLIGLGDLLLSKPELGKPMRIQGCFVSNEEIKAVVEFIKQQGEPEYNNEILTTNVITLGDSSPMPNGAGQDDDPLVWEAADICISAGFGSTSNLQRRLKVGYSRAGRIMDQLEEKGIVGPANGSKPREVLVDALELETLKAFEAND
ncbi:MAG: DNA translocase FtsK 4TM domain-containing protein [Phoenicibacter congonensis]|uniref:DNA translocase FtsK 4TM domain-containing protein n=1 Tax=Phoenicibacter congonensis TaxID=1944646 RepID=A0AA43RGQ9_9ACTN|nr:DNA translocase FtsK 4TM domain-containing protein [Phoenicibacter congonensis]